MQRLTLYPLTNDNLVLRSFQWSRTSKVRRRWRRKFVESSPSPRPSPPGRGRAIRPCWQVRCHDCLRRRSRRRKEIAWSVEARSHRMKPVNDSPSLGGEGRGEGERQYSIRSHSVTRLWSSSTENSEEPKGLSARLLDLVKAHSEMTCATWWSFWPV